MKNPLSKIDFKDKKTILFIIVAVTLLYSDFNFITAAQARRLSSLAKKITGLKKDIAGLNKDLAALQDLKSAQAQTKEKMLAKQKKFISEEEVASLLQLISDAANKNNISVNEMKPVKETKAKDAKGAMPAAALNATPLFINLTLSGDYPHFVSFLGELENSEIYLVMQELKVGPQSNNYLKQTASMILATYVTK